MTIAIAGGSGFVGGHVVETLRARGALKTRSMVPALLSHVLWDLAVLFWPPYVRS